MQFAHVNIECCTSTTCHPFVSCVTCLLTGHTGLIAFYCWTFPSPLFLCCRYLKKGFLDSGAARRCEEGRHTSSCGQAADPSQEASDHGGSCRGIEGKRRGKRKREGGDDFFRFLFVTYFFLVSRGRGRGEKVNICGRESF